MVLYSVMILVQADNDNMFVSLLFMTYDGKLQSVNFYMQQLSVYLRLPMSTNVGIPTQFIAVKGWHVELSSA